MTTLYTAVGRFQRRSNGGGLACPVIFIGQKEYNVDLQEMMLWTILNWSILEEHQIEELYRRKSEDMAYGSHRSCHDCLQRLQRRGLVVSGTGETGEDALYHLLSCLYVIPLSNSLFLKTITFLKLTLVSRLPFSAAKKVFRYRSLTRCEQQVFRLSRQARLSTAEIIKCMEKKAWDLTSAESILDVLYDDEETTSDNIASLARCFDSRQPVILAVANLYLGKQIIFERGDIA